MFDDKKNSEVMLFVVRCAALLVLLVLGACVERRLWVRTDPPGAKVSINGERVGESPVAWRFDHYGTVLVEAQLDGHESVQKEVRLKTPPYQQPVLDFVTDVLIPVTIKDDHEVDLKLTPLRRLTPEEIEQEIDAVVAAARRARAESAKK